MPTTNQPPKLDIRNFFLGGSEKIQRNIERQNAKKSEAIELSLKDSGVKKFLLAVFPSLKVAKKELKVKSADAVYKKLATNYINKVYDNVKALQALPKLETKPKVKAPRPVRRPYDVLINITEVKIYRDDSKGKEYILSRLVSEVFDASSPANLRDQVHHFANDFYPYEDSESVRNLKSYTYEIKKTIKRQVKKQDVRMRLAKPFKASFLKYFNKIDPVSYDDHNGECVVKALEKHWGVGKKFKMEEILNEASLHLYGKTYKKKDGITAKMVLYLCKNKNISLLGYDQNENNFIKFTANKNGSKKYRAVVFYMYMSHFYIITDEATVRHISQSEKDNSMFTTDLLCEDDKPDIHDTYHRNLPLDE